MKKICLIVGLLLWLSLINMPAHAHSDKHFSIESGTGINYGLIYSIRVGYRIGKDNPWGIHAMYNEERYYSNTFQTFSAGVRYYVDPSGNFQRFLKMDLAQSQPKNTSSYKNYKNYVNSVIAGAGFDATLIDGFALTMGIDVVSPFDLNGYHFRPELGLKWLF